MPDEEKKEDSEEEEESDDVVDEVEEVPVKARARQSVSAEAYGEWNVKKAFTAPVIAKTDEQKDRLKSCLMSSFMFAPLDDTAFNIIIGAMKEVTIAEGEKIINRGDDGDVLYVIESGIFDCSIKDPDGEGDKVVKTCIVGDVFGELALLYNAKRAATVAAREAGVCWSLDRETFNHIVKESAQSKRNQYVDFLAKVPLLESMDSYERSQLADALRAEKVGESVTIVAQGDAGDKFYIVEDGFCIALKDGYKVMDYGPGDYFGELALIKQQTRAASVVAQRESKLLSIDGATFKRLLDIKDLEERASKYT
jgi:cAMP-dependent protein kinase regulator